MTQAKLLDTRSLDMEHLPDDEQRLILRWFNDILYPAIMRYKLEDIEWLEHEPHTLWIGFCIGMGRPDLVSYTYFYNNTFKLCHWC